MNTAAPIQIDMVSDLVCPWCWIGLRHLMFVIHKTPERQFSLTFRPFFLDAGIPREGVEYETYMNRKFPDPQRRANGIHMLNEAGQKVGIDFQFGKIKRRPNTLDAHRLMLWAQGQGLGLQMKELLFTAFFHDGRDIGDRAILAELSQWAGMDKDMVTELLATDRDEDRILEEVDVFQKMGISGVPTFIVNQRAGTSGALPPEQLQQFILENAD